MSTAPRSAAGHPLSSAAWAAAFNYRAHSFPASVVLPRGDGARAISPLMKIELLESRIAPASLTFTDVDGDHVVITVSGAGTLSAGGNVLFDGTGHQLKTLDLRDPVFEHAIVSVVATRGTGGDGLVNVG